MAYEITFLDPRHDAEPAFWEGWRHSANLWANWSWPVMRAGSWHSRAPLLLTVLRRSGEVPVAGVVAAWVRGAVPRARFCPANGWPAAGYLDIAAPQSSGQPGWWFDTADRDERASLFRAYVRAARRELRTAATGVLWRQVGPDDLAALPYRMLTRSTEPVAVLDTPFDDREQWLATLRLDRRGDMRRIGRILAKDKDLVVRSGVAGDVITPAELTRLARLNFEKHSTVRAEHSTGVRSLGWNRALLARDDVAAIAYRDNAGKLLGVGLILAHPIRPLLMSWGAEPPETGGRRHIYFDLYARMVDQATAAGCEAIVLGKGMAQLKADLGAKLQPQFAAAARTW
jgi:hypothetical protein